MLRKLKGSSWGVSSFLILTSYKILIRSLIDHAALTIPLLAKSTISKLEVIQNTAVRIAYRCDPRTTREQLLKIANLDSLQSRSIKQIDKYLKNSIRYDKTIVKHQLAEYMSHRDVQEGAISNRIPKITPLGYLFSNSNSEAKEYLQKL